jgi:hypothetical protein
MKNFFNSEATLEILNRIELLTPNHKPQWGKMNNAQMMAHCAQGLYMAMGNIKTKRTLAGKLLGSTIKKKLFGEAPLPKNSPTAKEIKVVNEREFEVEKLNLLNAVRTFSTGGEAVCTTEMHPFFGALTPTEWSLGQYKHVDHHLTQFGV